MNKKRGKLGQIWIETMIYTLIALVMIGAVLNWGRPKIEELQDKSIIEQTINVFGDIDSQVLSVVQGGAGNKRTMEVGLKKGSININGEADTISFEIETRYTYSEPGQDIQIGDVTAHTKKNGEMNDVSLMLNYSGVYDLTFSNEDKLKIITKSSTPYKLIISNTGDSEGKPGIDMNLG